MSRASVRHGYAYEGEIRSELVSIKKDVGDGIYFEKLVDTHMFKPLIRYARAQGYRTIAKFIIPRQPADFIVLYKGKVTFFECKSSKVHTSFNIKAAFHISKSGRHQLEMSHKILKAGGSYWFLICRRIPYAMKTYVVHPKAMQKLVNRVKRAKRKASIKWEILEKDATMVIEKGKMMRPWLGLEPLLDGSVSNIA